MREPLNIAIAGAGLAGLSTALGLEKIGHTPTLYEKRDALTEAGAGIQISPNAAHCLREHGLLDKALERGVETDHLVVFDGVKGKEITRCPLGRAMREKYGAPNILIHRKDLQDIFVEKIHERGISLKLSQDVSTPKEVPGGVTFLANSQEVETQGLVIADGFWSRLRFLIDPAEPKPYGHTAFRVVVKRTDLPKPFSDTITGLWLAPKAHIVHAPVEGGDTVNFVVVIEGGEQENGWDRSADRTVFEAGVKPLAPNLSEVVLAQDGWRAWSLGFVRLTQFSKGRMVLVGDAAHATLP